MTAELSQSQKEELQRLLAKGTREQLRAAIVRIAQQIGTELPPELREYASDALDGDLQKLLNENGFVLSSVALPLVEAGAASLAALVSRLAAGSSVGVSGDDSKLLRCLLKLRIEAQERGLSFDIADAVEKLGILSFNDLTAEDLDILRPQAENPRDISILKAMRKKKTDAAASTEAQKHKEEGDKKEKKMKERQSKADLDVKDVREQMNDGRQRCDEVLKAQVDNINARMKEVKLDPAGPSQRDALHQRLYQQGAVFNGDAGLPQISGDIETFKKVAGGHTLKGMNILNPACVPNHLIIDPNHLIIEKLENYSGGAELSSTQFSEEVFSEKEVSTLVQVVSSSGFSLAGKLGYSGFGFNVEAGAGHGRNVERDEVNKGHCRVSTLFRTTLFVRPTMSFEFAERTENLSDTFVDKVKQVYDAATAGALFDSTGHALPRKGHLGGIFIFVAQATSTEMTSVSHLSERAAHYTQAHMSGGGWGARGAMEMEAQNAEGRQEGRASAERSERITHWVNCIGPFATSAKEFNETLIASRSDWKVIDRGDARTLWWIWAIAAALGFHTQALWLAAKFISEARSRETSSALLDIALTEALTFCDTSPSAKAMASQMPNAWRSLLQSPKKAALPATLTGPFHIHIAGGMSNNRSLLSVTASGDLVDLFPTDDASGRQRWMIHKVVGGQGYNIIVSDGTPANRRYLSCTEDGSKVDLWKVDDASGRQRWRIFDFPGTNYCYILVVDGVSNGKKYLSVVDDGTKVDLYTHDDTSGRQRWYLKTPIQAQCLMASQMPNAWRSLLQSPKKAALPATLTGPFHIHIAGGMSNNRSLLSVTASGDLVDLFPTDDASGRQRWMIHKVVGGQGYNIIVSDGTPANRRYLSCTEDGSKVDLWKVDDASGRQRWRIFDFPGTNYCYILVVDGVSNGKKYLSVVDDGTKVDLYTHDDTSGRQRWYLKTPIQAQCLMASQMPNAWRSLLQSPKKAALPATLTGPFHIHIAGGMSNNRSLLSVTASGDLVDLFPTDDASGRQRWMIHKVVGGQGYNIIVSDGTPANRRYLSCTEDGSKVDLWKVDDASGRQRWRIFDFPGTNYCYILVVDGVSNGKKYLSVVDDGTKVDLYTHDDTSGRQRWYLKTPIQAQCLN
eukprot:CAMPEP_0196666520 /NCGR_PEP_ID=MMETSP1086-20130531/64558_1 /TAXON_ID=77921 /ORGANISM="Cyanoptyche  gloeocystis , Strain SAG4.97" /LENGTH=1132 /DNA_ID=CAMNT_0042003719 /DNA_START=144 /DNA_END=3542 /DNA_ORIENTATION=-